MHTIMTAAEQHRFQEFCLFLRMRGRKEKTLSSYQDAHASFCQSFTQNNNEPTDITKVTGLDVRAWKSSLLKLGREASTINHRLNFMRSYFEWAQRTGDVRKEHMEAIGAIADIHTQRLGAETLPPEELRRFLRAVELNGNKRDKAIIQLLLSGLRVSELVGLTVQDVRVSVNHGQLEIRGEHVKRSSHRIVPLNRPARIALKEYLCTTQPSEKVFGGQRGGLTASGVDKIVRKWGLQVGVSVHCHLLRHQFSARYLKENPGDLVGLQLLLGHGSLETTARHYVKKNLSDLEAGVERMES